VVATITQTATLRNAVDLLTERRIGALVVSGDSKAIEGIISERDIVAVAASGCGLDGVSARSCRSTSSRARSATGRSADVMTERRSPPSGGRRSITSGIVSIGDVVKSQLTELEQENRFSPVHLRDISELPVADKNAVLPGL
jgi:hypothetical protein